MTQPDISTAKDPDLRSAMAALLRAGEAARKAAIEAGTDFVIVRDGQLVFVEAKKLRQEQQGEIASATSPSPTSSSAGGD
jgi:hypothetical protein